MRAPQPINRTIINNSKKKRNKKARKKETKHTKKTQARLGSDAVRPPLLASFSVHAAAGAPARSSTDWFVVFARFTVALGCE